MSGWNALPNRLMLREDEFSWQGTVSNDRRFYLRRDKRDPSNVTDLLFGDLDDSQISPVFAEFIKQTGGLSDGQLTFSAIAKLDVSHDEVVAKYDRIKEIAAQSANALKLAISDCYLDTSGRDYSAVVVFSAP